ncbi:MAG: LCP family protein [Clostridium sp.]
MKRTEKSKKNKKMKTWKKVLIAICSIFAILIAIGCGYFFSLYNKMEQVEIDKGDLGLPSKEELSEYNYSKDIINIALFGIDAEEGMAGRSDAIMVATIDPVHKKIKLTSFMRDSYVEIPGRSGKDKMNHAYAFGGPQLAMKTLNQNFGLNVENFVSVNFTSLPEIVDAIGGVEINITSEEVPHIPGINSKGKHLLTGDQALAYSRIRYASGGDYKRTERHRTVLSAIFDKVINTSPSSYPSLMNKLLPFVKTNLSPSTILDLGTNVLSVGSKTLEQERFPTDDNSKGINVGGIYYLEYNKDTTIQQVRDYIFKDIK